MLSMSKEEFLECLADPEAAANTGIYDWDALKRKLQGIKGPFTARDAGEHAPEKGDFQIRDHLNKWAKQGALAKVKRGGRVFYMAASQVPEE